MSPNLILLLNGWPFCLDLDLDLVLTSSNQPILNMPPKKGKKGKAADNWEDELGESIAPANGDAAPPAEPETAAAGEEDDEAPATGLMAMMRKNREKRKKKGLSEDFVDPDANKASEPIEDLTAKAPVEANADDEFALPEKKGKGGKGGKQQPAKAAANADDVGEDGRMLTKAEKEKLKKEREKQRKKEQVRSSHMPVPLSVRMNVELTQCEPRLR